MSKVQSFLESYKNISEYCLVWAKLSNGNTTISLLRIDFGKVSFFSHPITSGIGANESFDADLIEKYPNLEDFRNYCVDYFDKKKNATKDETARINELKDLIVNSNNYKELEKLAQKRGSCIDFNIRCYNAGAYQTSYSSSCSINPIPFFGIIN